MVAATIMDVIYGIQVLPSDDPYIEIAEKAMLSVGEALIPGTFFVDFLPIRKDMYCFSFNCLSDNHFGSDSSIRPSMGSGCWFSGEG